MEKKEEKKTEIERKDIIMEYILHLKDTDRQVIVAEYVNAETGNTTAWEFYTEFKVPMKGSKGQSGTLNVQCRKKIEDAKTFERAFERFEKEAESQKAQMAKQAELKMSGIIVPGMNNNLPNPNDPFDLRGHNNPFGKRGK